jgi:hypothetical protein
MMLLHVSIMYMYLVLPQYVSIFATQSPKDTNEWPEHTEYLRICYVKAFIL